MGSFTNSSKINADRKYAARQPDSGRRRQGNATNEIITFGTHFRVRKFTKTLHF